MDYQQEQDGHSLFGFYPLTTLARGNLPGTEVPAGIGYKRQCELGHINSIIITFVTSEVSGVSISTDVRPRASATSLRDVGYFLPKLE